ncbi:hypothetical protein ACJMK2_042731 [Sinanodonta woodiana]|uniref:Apple domain-containing protein n=1 Tax=Sinanodonta woodiana TaxID=1069815 RepID=A0ABD3W9D5_SINWO
MADSQMWSQRVKPSDAPDDWNEMSQESGTPVNTQPVKLVADAVNSAFTLTYNFFDFNEQHPDLSNFNVLPCFTGDQQKMFLITFQGSYHPTLDGRLRIFQKNVRLTLAAFLSVSPLRFQNAQITFKGNEIYYTATMLEQAPVILDYIKSSNKVGIYTVDKNYYSISNPMDCASRCRTETSFQCHSFDYCPAVQICQLSRMLTPDGSQLNANESCDHYSQAVNNQNNVEITVSQAFIALRDLVYKNLLNVSIQTGSTLIVFPATSFASNMLPKDVNQTIGNMNLLHFTANRHNTNYATSDAQTQGGSVDQCAAQCINQSSFNCRGFSYCYDTGICQLSKIHPDQNPPFLPTQINQCDVYGRNYLDSYVPSPGMIPITMHDTAVTNVPDVNSCARQCTSYNAYTCKSFDYCPGTMNCYLRKSRALSVSPVSLSASGQCSHYKRNYLSDFTLSSTAQPITVGQNLLFANVTVEDCSKLCVDNSGSDCKSFAFCGATSSCRILSSQTVSNSAGTTQPLQGCDLYKRQDFQSSSSPFISNTVPEVTTGYSGAAMAGIAIGMLIPGMVLGAALLYFLRTKKLIEREQFNMSIVNTSHGKSDEDEDHGHMSYDNINYDHNQHDTTREHDA